MKPERSERTIEVTEREGQMQDGLVFTSEIRGLFSNLIEYAFLKALSWVTRLWAPEIGEEEKGGDATQN